MSSARASVALIILILGALFSYAGPRLDLPKPRLLKVHSFPRQFAGWTAVQDRKPDEEVQKALPTAVIMDRQYRNSEGRAINLLLLTAKEMRDIHSPAVCLPGSGWQTQSDKLLILNGQKITARIMAVRGVPFHVWYWYPPVPYPEPKHPFVRALYRWRLKAPGTYRPDTIADLSSSLLVRVIAPAEPGSQEEVERFAVAVQKEVQELIQASLRESAALKTSPIQTAAGGK